MEKLVLLAGMVLSLAAFVSADQYVFIADRNYRQIEMNPAALIQEKSRQVVASGTLPGDDLTACCFRVQSRDQGRLVVLYRFDTLINARACLRDVVDDHVIAAEPGSCG